MNLFTGNSPYYHLLKYLLFHLKHLLYRTMGAKGHILETLDHKKNLHNDSNVGQGI